MDPFNVDSRLYRMLDILADFFLLNLIWLLACVPIITIFPATAALFAVVRGWIRKSESGFFAPFWQHMRTNFWQSLVVGLLWSVLGLILVAEYIFVQGISSWVSVPLFVLLFLALFLYAATAVFLFPVMVHFDTHTLQIIKNSFFLAISSLGTVLACLTIVILAIVIVIYFPVSILLLGSLTAYAIYFYCHRKFQQFDPTSTNDG